ncbi:replication/maintenance protein RepL [Campylobacter jejuni]
MSKITEVNLTNDEKIKVNENKENGIKTTYIGHRTFVDKTTGEVIELEYVEKKVSHTLKKGWRRVYLEQFMEVLTGLYSSSKKLDIIEFILENLNSENQLTLTQAQVMKKLGVSSKTIVETYKYLIEVDFMKKQGSVFVVNPKFVCAFGSDKKNRTIAINYSYDEPSLFD